MYESNYLDIIITFNLQFIAGTGEKDGAALSSWARYLKNKYGNRGKENAAKDNAASSSAAAASSSTRRLSLGLPLRSNSTVVDSSDDDQKNMQSSPTSHTIIEAGTLHIFFFNIKPMFNFN